MDQIHKSVHCHIGKIQQHCKHAIRGYSRKEPKLLSTKPDCIAVDSVINTDVDVMSSTEVSFVPDDCSNCASSPDRGLSCVTEKTRLSTEIVVDSSEANRKHPDHCGRMSEYMESP